MYETYAKKKIIAIIVSLVVIAGVVVLADYLKSKSATIARTTVQAVGSSTNTPATSGSASSSQPAGGSSTSSTSSTTNSSGYKDGTYSASSNYFVPHGMESIQVNLTLSNGVITSASIQNSESNPTSAQYQEDFASAYKSAVVGQKISGLQIDGVSGASDTTQGFNQALAQIASEARQG